MLGSFLPVCKDKQQPIHRSYFTDKPLHIIGHDTTAVSLAFAIAQMGRNKNIQEKARKEVLSVLGDEAKDVLPTKEDLKEMKYLDAVIKEVCYLQYYVAASIGH